MTRRFTIVLLALCVSLLVALPLAGCGSKTDTGASQNTSQGGPLVGVWMPSGGSMTWQFTADGEIIQSLPRSVETTAGGMQNVTGTYTYDGTTLTLVLPTSDGQSTSTTMAVTLVSTDKFQVGHGGGNVVFNRQK